MACAALEVTDGVRSREDEHGGFAVVVTGGGVEDGLVELSDAIAVVREQLVAAQLAGRQVVAGQVVQFAVGKVTIEFSGDVKKVAGGGGGVKFLVFSADAKLEHTAGAGHKVTVELVPQRPDGTSFVVADGVDGPPAN